MYGVLHYESVGSPPQQRKYLVLREEGSGIFFVSSFTEWRRVPSVQGEKFDEDDDAQVVTLDHDSFEQLQWSAIST